ncbi:MAG: hypothetical protein J6T17_06475 [Clostridia bacterium]|nr:hypothetical protein [Clostridia bacterium]
MRLEIIQVDNGASHVNVSCNMQVNSSFSGAGGYTGNKNSFDGNGYNATLTYGADTINVTGTNGNYAGSGWYSVATRWIGTIPRSAGTFSIRWQTTWLDTDKFLNYAIIETGNISIMAYTPPNAKDTLSNYSAATIGSAVSFTVTNSTSYAHTDTLSYSIGGSSGNISSSFSVPANSTKTVSWTPAASLGAEIPNSFTGTVTLTLTTSGQGSNTYTCQLTVPSYTYTMNSMSVAKTNYAAIGGANYVAGKHIARWTMPTFPTAKYGATLTGTFYAISGGNVLYTKTVSSGDTADYTYGTAGTVTGSLRVEDSRGVMVQKTTGTTWVANPSVSVTFTAKRSGATTTVNLVASGTYSSTLSGLAATLEISKSGTPVQSAAGAGGTASISTTDTLALASSQEYVATMTDTLGNISTKRVTVPAAFQYIQVGGGANGKGVAIGRAASTSGTDKLEVGLPTTIDHYVQPSVYKAYLYTDTNNVTHAQDTVIHAPHVGYADLGLADTATLAVKFKALTDWLKTNYGSNSDVQASRAIVIGTFAGKSNGVTSQNFMYQVMFYSLSQAEAGGTAPRYSSGLAWSVAVADQVFLFGNNNGTFKVWKISGTEYTS